jgi:hypothetical protein
MALATTAEHTKATEEMLEAFESGSSERFRASDEAARLADRLLSIIWDEYRDHRREHDCQAHPARDAAASGALLAGAGVGVGAPNAGSAAQPHSDESGVRRQSRGESMKRAEPGAGPRKALGGLGEGDAGRAKPQSFRVPGCDGAEGQACSCARSSAPLQSVVEQ